MIVDAFRADIMHFLLRDVELDGGLHQVDGTFPAAIVTFYPGRARECRGEAFHADRHGNVVKKDATRSIRHLAASSARVAHASLSGSLIIASVDAFLLKVTVFLLSGFRVIDDPATMIAWHLGQYVPCSSSPNILHDCPLGTKEWQRVHSM
jgi:hypothetical protein